MGKTKKPKSVEDELEIIQFPNGAVIAKFRDTDECYFTSVEIYPLWTAA